MSKTLSSINISNEECVLKADDRQEILETDRESIHNDSSLAGVEISNSSTPGHTAEPDGCDYANPGDAKSATPSKGSRLVGRSTKEIIR